MSQRPDLLSTDHHTICTQECADNINKGIEPKLTIEILPNGQIKVWGMSKKAADKITEMNKDLTYEVVEN